MLLLLLVLELCDVSLLCDVLHSVLLQLFMLSPGSSEFGLDEGDADDDDVDMGRFGSDD